MKAYIKLEGHLASEVTMTKEGKYVVVVKSSLKDIEKSESIFYIEMTKNQWESLKKKEDMLYITGRIIVKKNIKDLPFIYVLCTQVSNGKEKNKKIKDEDVSSVKKESRVCKKYVAWFKDIPAEKFIEVESKNIKIMQSCHNTFRYLLNITDKSKDDIEKPIAARYLGSGEYELIVGLEAYLKSKLFDKKLRVFVTDLTREEFEKEYNIII